ncbi:MAG TPA: bifunctional adenosylcobinamide kinase/adenosylcobinamide-phosphate guanylyltransferase, partial [Thermoleophilia bacterium]|nr:bifunctional adenosylcobinamide kinase/adenosylcobinamide-phosphate guanylyltransferase [Thermoleophilia bacterium]
MPFEEKGRHGRFDITLLSHFLDPPLSRFGDQLCEDRMILVTGGTRSGKSSTAERLAGELGGRVLYVATAEARDEEMKLRIERHQADRPADWGTLDAPRDVVKLLREREGEWDTILFDCVTLYVTNLVLEHEPEYRDPEAILAEDMRELADYLAHNWPQSIVVTNE